MKMKIMYTCMAMLLMSACGNKKEGTAHIIQRRFSSPEKLVVTYRFHTGEKWIYDSTEINNKVIPHDSLRVIFNPGRPEENSLQIP